MNVYVCIYIYISFYKQYYIILLYIDLLHAMLKNYSICYNATRYYSLLRDAEELYNTILYYNAIL